MLKIGLSFKKNTNFTGKCLENSVNWQCKTFRALFWNKHKHIGKFSNLLENTFKENRKEGLVLQTTFTSFFLRKLLSMKIHSETNLIQN